MEQFKGFSNADRPTLGIAAIFDISGFTRFFNKPDLQYYITGYINEIVGCVETCIYGGKEYWQKEEEYEPFDVLPSMRKFLGDGMLYVWDDINNKSEDIAEFKVLLINRFWNLQQNLDAVNKKLLDAIPVADLPSAIKFGIAQGSLYRLEEVGGNIDFIGPCINLASRLVKYCPEVNFICSARLNISTHMLKKHGWHKVIAEEVRSFEKEIVIVDKDDYDSISEADRSRLFTEIGSVK